MTRLSDVMRREYLSVAPEDTMGEVAQKMVEAGRGSVIVKDYGRLIGILTERDMLKAMAGRVHTSDARVREWMTSEPVTAPQDMSVEEAAELMLGSNFRHLPVVDGETVVGTVSLRAVTRSLTQQAPAS